MHLVRVQLINSADINSTTLAFRDYVADLGNLLFLDFCFGSPGSRYDARILQNKEAFLPDLAVVDVDDHKIGLYLPGDSAYPISPCLQKPFPKAMRDRTKIQHYLSVSYLVLGSK